MYKRFICTCPESERNKNVYFTIDDDDNYEDDGDDDDDGDGVITNHYNILFTDDISFSSSTIDESEPQPPMNNGMYNNPWTTSGRKIISDNPSSVTCINFHMSYADSVAPDLPAQLHSLT